MSSPLERQSRATPLPEHFYQVNAKNVNKIIERKAPFDDVFYKTLPSSPATCAQLLREAIADRTITIEETAQHFYHLNTLLKTSHQVDHAVYAPVADVLGEILSYHPVLPVFIKDEVPLFLGWLREKGHPGLEAKVFRHAVLRGVFDMKNPRNVAYYHSLLKQKYATFSDIIDLVEAGRYLPSAEYAKAKPNLESLLCDKKEEIRTFAERLGGVSSFVRLEEVNDALRLLCIMSLFDSFAVDTSPWKELHHSLLLKTHAFTPADDEEGYVRDYTLCLGLENLLARPLAISADDEGGSNLADTLHQHYIAMKEKHESSEHQKLRHVLKRIESKVAHLLRQE